MAKLSKDRWKDINLMYGHEFLFIMYCHLHESYIYDSKKTDCVCDSHFFTLKAWGAKGYR